MNSRVRRVNENKVSLPQMPRMNYGISDDRTLEFFTAHMKYDVRHSEAVAALIDRHCEPESAERATREAADALWTFLDGMCQRAGIACA